jgi:hypothetical protein
LAIAIVLAGAHDQRPTLEGHGSGKRKQIIGLWADRESGPLGPAASVARENVNRTHATLRVAPARSGYRQRIAGQGKRRSKSKVTLRRIGPGQIIWRDSLKIDPAFVAFGIDVYGAGAGLGRAADAGTVTRADGHGVVAHSDGHSELCLGCGAEHLCVHLK